MDFTTRRERRGTAATKWEKYAGTDILPFWVADMEFETAEPILEALHRRVDHGILGYTTVPESLTEATLAFLQTRYGWVADPSWIVWLPGVVPGFNLACRCRRARGSRHDDNPGLLPLLRRPGKRRPAAHRSASGTRRERMGHGLRRARGRGHPGHPSLSIVQSPEPHGAGVSL